MLFMYVFWSTDRLQASKLGGAVSLGWVAGGWRGLQAYSSSESPFTEETHLQSIWFNGGWQRERGVWVCVWRGGWRGEGGRVGWHCMQRWGEGAADRYKDKGTLSERESSWKMADSFLVQEKGSHWSGGDGVPSRCPSWSWRPSSPKGHPPLPHLSTPPTHSFPTIQLSLTDIFFSATHLG